MKVSFTDLTTAKWVLPVGLIVAGTAIAAGQIGHNGTKTAATQVQSTVSQSQNTEVPAPQASSKVTVNGTDVPGGDGSTDVPTGNGKAHVEVSGGTTHITTSTGRSGDTSNQQTNNVDINLNSTSNGSSNSGSTQVFSSNNSSNNGSSSFSSTNVFSTGSDHVSVSQ